MRYRNTLIAVVALLVPSVAGAGEGDWTRFRGPDGAGISDASTVPVTWTEKDYNWKVKVPGVGHSSPVLHGKRIFLTSAEPGTARRLVLCLDAADGHTLWQRDYPSKGYRQHSDNSYATATPAADAEGVVVTWTTPDEVLLVALDSEGRETWRRDLGPFVGERGSGTSPILFGDLVVLANDQEDPNQLPENLGKPDPNRPVGKSFLIAVDRRTGKTRWQIERRTALAAYSTPCVYRPQGGPPELIFTSTSHGITGVDPVAGRVTWEIGGLLAYRCVGSPVVAPGLAFAGHGHGIRGTRFVAVRPGSRANGIEPSLAYDVTKSLPLVPTPLVKDGRLFLWGDDGVVTCLRAAAGEVIWRQRVGGSFYSSPVCVDNRLYGVARNGEVVVLAAADKFELLARVPLGEGCFATPAVAGGVMYLRTVAHLFSLGGKKEGIRASGD
jgi:outer membrane protein assembly factor BamB